MKILFDYQTFEQQKFGGVSRYFFELYSQFKKKEGVECEIEISYSSNQYIKTIPEINNKIIGPQIFIIHFCEDSILKVNTESI